MKPLLFVFLPALACAASITTGVACNGGLLQPAASSGAYEECQGTYSTASSAASLTTAGDLLSFGVEVSASWGQPLSVPYAGGAEASAGAQETIVTEGPVRMGYVEIVRVLSASLLA